MLQTDVFDVQTAVILFVFNIVLVFNNINFSVTLSIHIKIYSENTLLSFEVNVFFEIRTNYPKSINFQSCSVTLAIR